MKLGSQELADLIVEELSEGKPLRQICREQGVSKSAVYEWMERDAEFGGRIPGARARGYDNIAEEALAIADDGRRDYIPDEDGGVVVNHDHIQRSKLRIETRLKLLAKWDPKRYGDKVQQEVSGPGGKDLLPPIIQIVPVSK